MQMNSKVSVADNTLLVVGIDRGFGVGAAGPEAESRAWIARHPSLALVYVSGRTVASARTFVQVMGLPVPDVIIADSGASVVPVRIEGDFSQLEADLQRSWAGPETIRQRLAPLAPWIEPQPWMSQCRVPYFIRRGVRPTEAVVKVRQALSDAPAQVLCANDEYIDVVPAGVSRASTLDRVRLWAGWQRRGLVVVAAAAADLPLLQRAQHRIVVPGADREVLEVMAGQPRMFASRTEAFHGTVNGLHHFSREG